jgi:pilus assembly protein CpaE
MSTFLLATPDAEFEHRIRAALAGVASNLLLSRVATADEIDAALKSAPAPVDVVAVGPGVSLEEALGTAQQLDLAHPEVSVLLVAEPTPDLWQQALRAGVRDVVDVNAEDTDLAEVFERAADKVARRRAHLAGEVAQEAANAATIITVLSPKGGAGKTTVATNLAAGIAAYAPGRVALVDADLQFGDVAGALHLMPEHSVADAARLNGALDAMSLKVFLTHHPAELYALCAPESPVDGDTISGDSVAHIIKLLASEFDYVIVDTSAGLSESTLSALEVSTDVVAVTSMDVPSVRATRKLLDVLDQLGMNGHRRHHLLNRADSKVGLDTADIEASLQVPLDVVLPSSRAVPLALNQGLPVIHTEPRSPVSRQLRTLIDRFAPAARSVPAAAPQSKLFSRRGSR